MRLPVLAAAAALVAGPAFAEPDVDIRDAVARVTVIPEAREDVKVEILTTNRALPLKVERRNGRTIIDGDLKRRIRGCDSNDGEIGVTVAGLGKVAWADMPQIVVRTPMAVDIGAGGAVFGAVGRSRSVELGASGCGGWTIANTEGMLRVSSAGSGKVRAGQAGEAVLRMAGSADTAVGEVRGPLSVDLAGSGDVAVRAVAGDIKIKIAGSGDVDVTQGRAGAVDVLIAGSGDFFFGGAAQTLKARIMGSGDVRASRVSGAVERSVMGSGRIRVGD